MFSARQPLNELQCGTQGQRHILVSPGHQATASGSPKLRCSLLLCQQLMHAVISPATSYKAATSAASQPKKADRSATTAKQATGLSSVSLQCLIESFLGKCRPYKAAHDQALFPLPWHAMGHNNCGVISNMRMLMLTTHRSEIFV